MKPFAIVEGEIPPQAKPQRFDSCLWLPPRGDRGGDILLADSTIFTTLFGGAESLERFWRNMASMR